MKTVVNRGIIRFSPFHPCSHHPAQYLFSLALIPPGAITTVFPNHRHCCSPSHKPLSSSPSPSPLFFFLFRVAATMLHHCLPPLHLFFLFCLSSFFIFVVMVNNIMLLTSFLYFTSTYLKKN